MPQPNHILTGYCLLTSRDVLARPWFGYTVVNLNHLAGAIVSIEVNLQTRGVALGGRVAAITDTLGKARSTPDQKAWPSPKESEVI